MIQLPGFFRQETGQGFLLVAGALYLFWTQGAPEYLLWLVAGIGGLYILGEKVRAIFHPKGDR